MNPATCHPMFSFPYSQHQPLPPSPRTANSPPAERRVQRCRSQLVHFFFLSRHRRIFISFCPVPLMNSGGFLPFFKKTFPLIDLFPPKGDLSPPRPGSLPNSLPGSVSFPPPGDFFCCLRVLFEGHCNSSFSRWRRFSFLEPLRTFFFSPTVNTN